MDGDKLKKGHATVVQYEKAVTDSKAQLNETVEAII